MKTLACNVKQKKVNAVQNNQENKNYLVPTLPFLLKNNSLKDAKFSEIF